MKRSQVVSTLVLAFALCAPLAAPKAEAADAKRYRITNNTGRTASDLHVTFSGTGGDLTSAVVVNPPGCPAPAIPSNGTVTNTMVLDWGVDCVAPGASVTVDVSTVNGPLRPEGGFWTSRKKPRRPGIGPVDPERDVEELDLGSGVGDGPFCCKYVCFDLQLRPYLIEICNEEDCENTILGPGDHECHLVAKHKVSSCKECPSRVLSGSCRKRGGTTEDD